MHSQSTRCCTNATLSNISVVTRNYSAYKVQTTNIERTGSMIMNDVVMNDVVMNAVVINGIR